MTFHGYFQKSTPDAPLLRLVIGPPVPSPRIPQPDLDANIAARWQG